MSKVVIAEQYSDELNRLIKENGKDWQTFAVAAENKQEFIERIGEAVVASGYSFVFDEEVFAACPDLKYLAIAAVGAEAYVDMKAAEKYGVTVMNCPGYNSRAVAEAAIGFMIALLRNMKAIDANMADGEWDVDPAPAFQLRNKRIALIEYGNIGKTIEKLLSGWENEFVPINSQSSDKDIDAAVSSADIVVLCCPLNDKTRGIISAKRLASMKRSALLINVARGAVVDEDALYEALRTQAIAGAGLDVFMNEPGSSGSVPENIKRFTTFPHVICNSHVAGSSEESRVRLGTMIYENIESAPSGQPINIYK